ncbi:cell division topological specificity factor [Constrictibacter sp. MBR-5]|jgi:cell division topological specificity factor|uniref:cell division topological specificity factor MinE n=1 Tax=Constrictibacter sp. MBR-5 TaxID=3156467 RepID=UPI0033970E8F
MNLLSLFRRHQEKTPAAAAKDRLTILLSHERSDLTRPDYLPMLQKDIIAAIRKYVDVDDNKVDVKLERAEGMAMLEVDIELPGGAGPVRLRSGGRSVEAPA